MKTIVLLFLAAFLLTFSAGWLAHEQEREGITCLVVMQHVNAVYERAYRGEVELSPGAVRELQWLERRLCAQEVTPAGSP